MAGRKPLIHPRRRLKTFFTLCHLNILLPIKIAGSTILLCCVFYVLLVLNESLMKVVERKDLKKTILEKTSTFHYPITNDYLTSTHGVPYTKQCQSLKNCFNFKRCKSGFKIYVYPQSKETKSMYMSDMYKNILAVLNESKYYTDNMTDACIFVLPFDTLNRDFLGGSFIKELNNHIQSLKHWNDGENHIIFNLFSGTYPFYNSNLHFNIGKALIAKTSLFAEDIRENVDLSIPLLPSDFPKTFDIHYAKNPLFPLLKKYLVTFKGKRYLYGFGSDTRNALHVLNNNRDILFLTTCIHNQNWEKFQDIRCWKDNADYEKYDYKDLLTHSTFCGVPRGRRLASFRFLEALRYGCIPVLLSNGWDLPFHEVIDYSKFSITVDERQLLQLPTILRAISMERVLRMKQQALFIFEKYFSSIQNVINTAIEILRERIEPQFKKSYWFWNQPPGSFDITPGHSGSILDYPFHNHLFHAVPIDKFTLVVIASSLRYNLLSPLFKLIKIVNHAPSVDQILVVWLSNASIPSRRYWPKTKVTMRVISHPKKTMNSRYFDMPFLNTHAIFTLDEDVDITVSDLEFAFSVWYTNPSRLVGFFPGLHEMEAEEEWQFTSEPRNSFSAISTSAIVFHRYYGMYYSTHATPRLHNFVSDQPHCASLAFNFLVSSVSNSPPLKVAHSLKLNYLPPANETYCFRELREIFGNIPLVTSKVAANPLLFKDPVSISRLKFKSLG